MTPPPSQSALRSLLAARLAARLGVDPSAINLQESFQAHGLDSSGAVGLIAELAAALGRTLSPTLIWAHPNPEALVRFLAGGDSGLARTARSVAADEPIAIVGMSCRFPGASDPEAFWRLVCAGIDATREVPVERWDPDGFYDPDPEAPGTTNTRRGAFLDRIDEFDPLFFGISPREAAEMDPQQRIMLELAWEALEDAGVPPRDLAGTRAGVFFGVVWRDYAELHRAAGATVTSHTGVGQGVTIVANRVSYALGLRGPSLVVDTACSSSLVAVHLACQSLRSGESTVALAGGVNLMLLPETMVALTKFGGLSGEGRCKAFDARADGFARGEGAGVVVLKPLSRALADGDPIYCVIRGSAVNNDGASNGLTAPNPLAQVEVLQEAWERAGIDPGRVQVVEAHGTGTPLGDPIEARVLSQVLCVGRDPDRPLVIGSVKTNIGHLEGAAGIAGLIKLALAIHHQTVPPSLHFERPNPDIPFAELGLRVQTALGPWPMGEGPALGGVSSFGWGGTNCHVVMEGGLSPSSPGEGGWEGTREEGRGDEGLFVFSGIGAQWPGMGMDLLRSEPVFRARLEACDRALAPLTGWSVIEELVSDQDTGGGRWERVDVAVPAIFAVEVALAALWRSWGVEPAAVIGHSIGEFAAAHVAGLLSLEDAARIAFHYSRLLARLAGTVGLGVVQLPADEVAERIADEGDRLAVAGWSSPSSTLVAGEPESLDRFLAAVAAQGLFSARVPSDVASHCPQVEPLIEELRRSLAGLSPRTGRIAMISTVTGEPVSQPLDADYWAANLRRPVRFAQAVEHAVREGYDTFLEVDPHPILATPLEQCFAAFGADATVLPSLRRGEEAGSVLLDSLRVLGYRPREAGPAIVPLSARSLEARRELALRTAARLREPGSETVGDFGWTAALRRTHHEHRLAVVGRSRDEVAERLEAFAHGETPPGVIVGRAGRERGGLVFAYSGQGPQWSGMGRQLLEDEPVFRDAIERCDAALRPWLGGSLMARLEEEGAMERTELAQPALFALQVGLTAVWRPWGVIPDAVVGHSVGEIAAAWAAGVLSLEEAARVAAVRGRAMAGARGRGGMVAVEMSEEEARDLLADLGSSLEVAAVNGPASTVLAGAPQDLAAMLAELARRGATGRRLRVDYAFHTVQMEPFDAAVEAELSDLRPRPAAVPLISTVTGRSVQGSEMDGAYWRRNVRQPVRFTEAVSSLAGHAVFLEIGPHPVLAASIAQGLESAAVLASLRRGRDERETLLEALGGLYVLGRPIDWRGVFPDGGRRAPLPTYPFQRQRYWFETPSRPAVAEAPSLLPAAMPEPAVAPGFEALLADQLDAFNRMVALQLEVLGRPEDLDS